MAPRILWLHDFVGIRNGAEDVCPVRHMAISFRRGMA